VQDSRNQLYIVDLLSTVSEVMHSSIFTLERDLVGSENPQMLGNLSSRRANPQTCAVSTPSDSSWQIEDGSRAAG
jgi:hypothetical protein